MSTHQRRLAALFTSIMLSSAAPASAQQATEAELSATFAEGRDAFERGDYAAAADAYLEVAARDHRKTYLAESLHNAAISMEMQGRFAAASEIHTRVHAEAPNHPYAGYALYRSAVTAERALNFSEAIDAYAAFHTKHDGKKTPAELSSLGLSYDLLVRESLAASARLLDYSHRHGEAARGYMAFAKSYPGDPDSPRMLESAIRSFDRAGEHEAYKQAIDLFLERHERDAELWANVLSVMFMKEAYERDVLRSDAMADYTLQLIGDLNGARKPARGSTDARFAARTALEHANRESKVLRRMTITGSVGAQARQIDALLHSAESTMALYEEVFTYGDVDATLSAAVEINNNFEHLAHTLRKSTPPHPVGTVLYQAYRLRLDEMAKSFEAEVIVRYEAIGKKARSAGIDTAATRYAVERLHAHDPLTFPPPPHDATPHIEERTLTARLLTSAEASQ